jgi:hypothetical protein
LLPSLLTEIDGVVPAGHVHVVDVEPVMGAHVGPFPPNTDSISWSLSSEIPKDKFMLSKILNIVGTSYLQESN